MARSVLMLGGTGTLSKTIAVNADKIGYEVTVINRGLHNDSLPDSINKLRGDFYDADSLSHCVNGKHFDVVIDFLSRQKLDIERTFPIFADKCEQYVFISSCCVFRRAPEDFPIVENSPKPNTSWKYNIEKYESEQSLIQLRHKLNLCHYTIIRPYITYDENRIPIAIAPKYVHHNTILERIRHGKPMFVIDEGKAISTVTYVEDFAKGVLGLLLNQAAYNEDFNVVGDFCYTHKEILETLYRILGITPNIVSIPRDMMATLLPNYAEMILGDRALNAKFDNSKLKAAVPGLRFEYDLNKGLRKILENYDQKGKASLIDYQYEGQIDRMLRKIVKFSGRYREYFEQKNRLKYLLFSCFPYKFALKLEKFKMLKLTRK